MIDYDVLAEQNTKGGDTMTQLIAAICDGGQTVVTVSDRMVATGDMTLTFEPEESKAQPISNKAVVLLAGTLHEPDLIRDAREKVRGKERIREIADGLKEIYQELRATRIEDEVLRPCAGIRTIAEYHDKQTKLHDTVVMDVNERMRRYDLGLVIVLAGVDEQAHVIQIGNPGAWRSYDNLGYCCTGIGNRHADNVFAWYKYTQSFPVNEALYIAFEAKRRAEMAGGVGRATDALIVSKDGVKAVTQETIGRLGEIYDQREGRGQRTGFDKSITELTIETAAVATA